MLAPAVGVRGKSGLRIRRRLTACAFKLGGPAGTKGESTLVEAGSSAAVNDRPSRDEDKRTETSQIYLINLGETTNLCVEQDQIGPNSGVARAYWKIVSIGTGKVARPR